MSLASEVVDNSAINNLVESEDEGFEWISYEEITDVEPTKIDNVYYANRENSSGGIILILLGSDEECTPTLVSEFARIYSLPTHKYIKDDGNQFRRYTTWLKQRNKFI